PDPALRSLHAALPISSPIAIVGERILEGGGLPSALRLQRRLSGDAAPVAALDSGHHRQRLRDILHRGSGGAAGAGEGGLRARLLDRKSTRLNSSHQIV